MLYFNILFSSERRLSDFIRVKNDDFVSTITCSVQALCGFCGYCSTGRLAPVAMTDCSEVKLRSTVLFLCGRESSYTGGKGNGIPVG